MRNLLAALLAAAALALLLAFVPAPVAAAPDDGERYTIPPLTPDNVRAEVRERNGKKVLVVTVRFEVLRDRDKQLATDLATKLAEESKKDPGKREVDIQVREDGKLVKEVRLTRLPRENALNTVLVIDCSYSMKQKAAEGDNKTKIEAMFEAASAFVDRMPENSYVSLLPFSDTVPPSQPFTNDRKRLKADLARLKPLGGTLLYDAIGDGIQTVSAARRVGKSAVIVLTDGKDESPGSRLAPDELILMAREAGVPLYLVGLGPEREINEPVMKRMAKETGGSYQRAATAQELFKLFSGLANDLHESFELEYDSPRSVDDGTARSVEIAVLRRSREGKLTSVSNAAVQQYARRGVVVPEMSPLLYLPLLVLLGGLLALPYGLSRLARLAAGKPAP